MNEEEKKIYIKLFELGTKQTMCKLYLARHKKIAYTQDEVSEMFKNIKVEENLKQIEEEMFNLVSKNQKLFDDIDKLKKIAKENLVSFERQRELSRECIGKKCIVEDLI